MALRVFEGTHRLKGHSLNGCNLQFGAVQKQIYKYLRAQSLCTHK